MANKDFKVKNGLDIQTPLPVSMGGTGQTSTNNTLNSLLPSQSGNANKILQTDGTNTTWVTLPTGYTYGNTASRPSSPFVGQIYSNTQTGYIEVYTSSNQWSQLGVIPGSATIGTATDVGTNVAYGSGSVDVTFTPSGSGGLASTFTATSSPGGITGSNSSSPVRVTGLTQGTAYTFNIIASNGYGNAVASSSSNSVTPTSVPQAPTIGTPTVATGQAYGANANVSVPFTANATGGKSITSYLVTSSSGNTNTGASSPILVSDQIGVARTYTVQAINANGNSSSSSASTSATPTTVPQNPTIGTATNIPSGRAYNNGRADVTFTAPSNNGGLAITGYTVTSSPGGYTGTGSSSPISVTGLQSNTAYTFTVLATNSNGNSTASAATSPAITATTVPQAPTIGTATKTGTTTATLTFTAPNNGGSTITSFTATSSPGGITSTLNQAGSGTFNITGLSPGTAYTFTVTATNANGTSAASSASNSITTDYLWDIMVVAGGGSGGTQNAGGGGAGGFQVFTNQTLTRGAQYTVTVGAGAAAPGGATFGNNGGNSQFGSYGISYGGGGGYGSGLNSGAVAGYDGGSGGGSGGTGTSSSVKSNGVAGQGYGGGATTSYYIGGGGGGATSVGGDSGGGGGAGGTANSSYSTWATATSSGVSGAYAGGGGGGPGGPSGGGGGTAGTGSNSSSATANTGGGSGGTRDPGTGGNGGSGIVIVRYPGSQVGSGGTVYNSGGYTYHKFTASGTFTA